MKNGDFANMTELESYFKRMVMNAKDFYPRNSQVFEDAERVRKALSNYMVKNNPAYQTKGYQAFPTPLPPEGSTDDASRDDSKSSRSRQSNSRSKTADKEEVKEKEDDESPAKDEEDDPEADEGNGEEEDDGDEGAEEEEEEDDEAEEEPVLVIPKRRGPGRPPKNPVLHAQKMAAKAAMQGKADSQYQNVPYKGLNFQQAQEKIVEELLRKKGDG